MNKLLCFRSFLLFGKEYNIQYFKMHRFSTVSPSLLYPKCYLISKQLANNLQENRYSTIAQRDNFVNRIRKKLFNMMSDKSKINIGACLCYENCVDGMDWNYFINYFKLPDTFNSWFLSIQLHVWMIALVAVSENNGRMFRNQIIDEMWNDVEMRLEKLTYMKSSTRKENLKKLLSQFNAALISYDEGILEDDKALAAAVWRTVYGFEPNTDPRLLEKFVFYIRKQMSHLDSLNTEELMHRGKITFLPLHEIMSEIDENLH